MAASSSNDYPTPAVPFSYAQAAKGKSTQSSNSTPAQRPTSASSSQLQEPLSNTQSMSAIDPKVNWAEDSTDTAKPVSDNQSRKLSSDSDKKASEASRPISRENGKLDESQTSASDLSTNSSSTTAKDDDTTSSPQISSEPGWEDGVRESTSTKEPDASTERSSSRGKSSERSESKPPAKQLRDAPPPAVNIWAQRAQDAKAKQSFAPSVPRATNANTEAPVSSTQRRQANKDFGVRDDAEKSEKNLMGQKANRPVSRNTSTDLNQRDWMPAVENSSVAGTRPGQSKQSRSVARQDSAPLKPALPAVRDAISWPTPENAQDDERRKSQGKVDKPESERPLSGASKHEKKEWVSMSFTPTVKFNTPFPVPGKRGGRGGARGSRDSSSRGGSVSNASGDRATASSSSFVPTEAAADSSKSGSDSTAVKSSSLPTKTRRRASDGQASGQASSQDQNDETSEIQPKGLSLHDGKDSIQTPAAQSGNAEATTQSLASAHEPTTLGAVNVAANPSSTSNIPADVSNSFSAVKERSSTSIAEIPPFRQKPKTSPTQEQIDASARDTADEKRNGQETPNGKPHSVDRRADTSGRTPDRFSDAGGLPFRERGDGRPERGRGGRGRPNGGHFQNSHSATQQYPNGHLPQIQTNHPHHPKNGPSIQSAYGAYSGQYINSPRNPRPGPRSASIPSEGSYSRYPGSFSSGYPGSAPIMNGVYDYPMQPMGAAPYQPYFDQMMLLNTVAHQMAYYFSLDNLIKDLFLRKHMDSQGFVALSLIASFKRMKDLTTDVEMIKYVSASSSDLELRTGSDGKDRLRRREDWQRWVLSMEERDPSAQNDGPAPPDPSQSTWAPIFDQQALGRSPMSPAEMSTQPQDGMASPFQGMMHHSFTPAPVASPVHGMSSTPSRPNRYSMPALESDQYQISQSLHPTRSRSPNEPNDEPDSFPDEQIEGLTVVVQETVSQSSRPILHPFASRTFSNGSIDAQSLPDDLRRADDSVTMPSQPPNGSTEGGRSSALAFPSRRIPSRSPSGRAPSETSVGTFWIKGKGEVPVPLPDGSTYEPYPHLRMKAFQQRQNTRPGQCPYDMDVLYKFWSHFLIRNFNTTMYNEFRQLAHEDFQNNSNDTGMEMLIQYYSEALSSQQTIRNLVAKHYVELVKAEDPSKSRLAFKKLRVAWRDGALNIKNRRKIVGLVDQELRDSLDR